MHSVLTVLALALLLILGASSQERPPQLADVGEVSLEGFGDRDPTCQQWTDGCRVCARAEGDQQFCSNIGPACQPTAISCAQRRAPAK
jgi:hypothetical protein